MSQDREAACKSGRDRADVLMKNQVVASETTSMKTQTKLVANLHSAANEGKVELVRLLLRCGADVNSQDEQHGNTALHQAAWNGFSQTVQVLCKYRANTSIKNKAQFTPLHLACQQGHNQTARLLLMANAKTEAKNSYGDTPLHTAARYGHAGVARILISASCNPNQVNKNHDTPLHIAAAMGRRKLTKIFMQNGAEPAIKNKQNETAMDIALRKDLIDIQELIANPPPVRSGRRALLKTGATHSQVAAMPLSQLELRFGAGQLYGRLAAASRRPAQRTIDRQHRHQQRPSSDEDEDDDDDGHQLSDLGLARLTLNDRCNAKQRAGRRRNWTAELAVDVPGDEAERKRAADGGEPRLVNRANRFASLHSLSGQQQQRQPSPKPQLQRRLRTKTLLTGSGLDLLPTLLARRKDDKQPSNGCRPQSSQACLLPDARDDDQWTSLMGTGAEKPKELPAVIEAQAANRKQQQCQSRSTRLRVGLTKSSSPVGSLRSSLSKSRGKLLLRQRQRQKGSLLVRRPNLGTCVGKLSLKRLRVLSSGRREKSQRPEHESEEPEGSAGDSCQAAEPAANQGEPSESKSANEDASANTTMAATRLNAAADRQQQRPVAAGRRQERLERSGEVAPLPRAPNGTPLLATRPLAALDDDTQLYAIPKKPKPPKQQVLVCTNKEADQSALFRETKSGDHCKDQDGRRSAANQPPPVRVSSGGPALTSDGGLSSSAGSLASSLARMGSSNIVSSSDECIESVDIVCVNRLKVNGARDVNDMASPGSLNNNNHPHDHRPAVVGVHADKDLYDNVAPGYSVIGEQTQRRKPMAALQNGHSDPVGENDQDPPCLCPQLNGLSLKQEPTVEQFRNSVDRHQEQSSQAAFDALSQQKTQANNGNANNEPDGEQQVVQSKTSKLRQLLHLERNKAGLDSNKNKSASADTQKVSGKTEPSNGQQKVAGRLPMSAVAGGYYAYSPVVQSSSELQQHQTVAKTNHINSQEVKRPADSVATKSGSKKSWLMSKFSLSTTNLTHHENPDSPLNQPDSRAKGEDRLDYKPDAAATDKESVSSSSALLGPPERKAELISIRAPPLDQLDQSQSQIAEEASSRLIRPKSALSGASAELIAAQKSLAAAAAAKVRRDRMVRIASNDGELASGLATNELAASKEGVLTVKTSDPFWLHHHDGGHQPTLVAAGAAGQKYMDPDRHRSGTNSVGMSDSSPSNNGAESDNSIQTTSGSLATDNTSGGQPFASDQSNLSPFGILSRILINNKRISTSYSGASNKSPTANQQDPEETNSSESTLKQESTKTNPSSAAPSTTCLPGGNANQKLDQLSSRSRCPIVATNSNSSEEQPPQLPAKGVLKTSNANRLAGADNAHSTHPEFKRALIESMNGLPHVASYNRITALGGLNQAKPLAASSRLGAGMMEWEHQLCNYHAMNRSNQTNPMVVQPITSAYGANYSKAYQPHPTLSRTYQYDQSGKGYPLTSHMSQHELRSYGAPDSDLALPGTAINYEYFLESDHHLPSYHQSAAARYHYGPSEGSMYPATGNGEQHFERDDSIYIPYVNSGQMLRDTSGVAVCGSASGHYLAAKPAASYLDFRSHRLDQQQRPKSSLDTFLLSSVNAPAPNPDGRRLSVSNRADSTAHILHARQRPDYPASSKHSAYYSPQSAVYHSSAYNHGNGYLYAPENGIYAGDPSSDHFHRRSDLTVLPTTPTLACANELAPASSSSSGSPSSSSYQQNHQALVEGQSATQLPGGGKGSSSVSFNENGVAQVLSHSQAKPNSAAIDRLNPATASGKQVARSRQMQVALEDQQQERANSWTPTPYTSLVQVNQTSSAQSAKSNQSSAKLELASQQRPLGEKTDISSIVVTNGTDKNHRRQLMPSISNKSASPKSITCTLNGQLSGPSTKGHLQTKVQINSNRNSADIVEGRSGQRSTSPSSVQMPEECNGSTIL